MAEAVRVLEVGVDILEMDADEAAPEADAPGEASS